jgi:prepilin signal peptidase PulO-like enzyme (type II secretory pathway)
MKPVPPTCGFCGTRINPGFNVCPACGAIWEPGNHWLVDNLAALNLGIASISILAIITITTWVDSVPAIVAWILIPIIIVVARVIHGFIAKFRPWVWRSYIPR